MGLSRNFTEGAFLRRVRIDELEERMDFAGAGRVREDAIDDDTEPERLREVRDGAMTRSLVCPSTGELEFSEDLEVLGRIPIIPDQNEVWGSSKIRASSGE